MRTSIRIAVSLAAAAILGAPAAARTPVSIQTSRRQAVAALLANARAALGGDARLSAVERFVIKGSTENGLPDSRTRGYAYYEITCELPDSFAMTTSSVPVDYTPPSLASDGLTPIQHVSGSPTIGFDHGELIYDPPARVVLAPFTRPDVVAVDPTQAELDRNRREAQEAFLRTTLGLFATSFAAVPVRFDPVPYDANAVWVTGAGVPRVLEFDPVTHLPSRFGDHRWSDYRDVDGVMVPFRTTRNVRGYVTTWIVKTIRFDEPAPRAGRRR